MEETFEEKKRRALVERYGVVKGNRVAEEGLTKPSEPKETQEEEYELAMGNE